MKKWSDGTVKSSGNAFDWKGKPSIFTEKSAGPRLTVAQVIDYATRVNGIGSLGAVSRVLRKFTKEEIK